MKEYTVKEIKLLKANPYTFKVTKSKLYFTIEFKEVFWNAYQAGNAPRKILEDLGYDLEIFSQKQIDSLVQRSKMQAQSGYGFRQGENRIRWKSDEIKRLDTNNNERYQWQLAKLSPDEYYQYITTGIYPLENIIKN